MSSGMVRSEGETLDEFPPLVLRNYLVSGVFLGLAYCLFFVFIKAPLSLLGPSVFLVITFISLYLYRLKNYRLSASAFVCALWAAPSWCIVVSGGVYSPLLIWIVPPVLIASLLLGWRWAFWIGAISFANLIFVTLNEQFLQPYNEVTDVFFLRLYLVLAVSSVIMYVIYYGYSYAHETNKARKVAERANLAKSQFLSSMSHELRTPLNAVLGFAQLLELEQSPPFSEEQKKCTREILKGGRHLLSLIDDLLRLESIEAGGANILIASVDSKAVIDECLAMMKDTAHKASVTISTAPFQGALVQADRLRLKQVMFNLLSNAVKYNFAKGAVTVSSAVTDGGMQRISVADTGRGIPADRHGELFKPFSRLGAENSSIEGTGIGLTISQQLIHAMNGQIGFDSPDGGGTTFWIELPLAK